MGMWTHYFTTNLPGTYYVVVTRVNDNLFARFDTQSLETYNAANWANYMLPLAVKPPGNTYSAQLPTWLTNMPGNFQTISYSITPGQTPGPSDARQGSDFKVFAKAAPAGVATVTG